MRIGDGVHFEAEEGTGEEGPGAERPAGPGLPRRLPQGRPLLEEAAGRRGTRGARRHSREEIKGSIGRSAECVCCVRPGRARGERWPRRAGGLRGEEQLQADVGLEEGDPRGRAKYDGRQGVQVGKQKRRGRPSWFGRTLDLGKLSLGRSPPTRAYSLHNLKYGLLGRVRSRPAPSFGPPGDGYFGRATRVSLDSRGAIAAVGMTTGICIVHRTTDVRAEARSSSSGAVPILAINTVGASPLLALPRSPPSSAPRPPRPASFQTQEPTTF